MTPRSLTTSPRGRRTRWVGLLLLATCSLAARAHDTWLLAEPADTPRSQQLVLQMTSGERFPVAGTGIAPERIERSACRQGNTALALKPGQREPSVLRLSTAPVSDQAMTCWVQLLPRSITLDAALVEHYLDEIDAPPALRAAWAAAPRPRRWTESYTKSAQLLLPAAQPGQAATGLVAGDGQAVGRPPVTTERPSPLGLVLEFLPDTDLLSGRLAGPLGVVLLRQGQPLTGVSVVLRHALTRKPQRLRSDDQGRVVFEGLRPGRWMLSATDLQPVSGRPGEWDSRFATLVFELTAVTP